MIRKFTISNDPEVYEAWPDVLLTKTGKLLCVFSECAHHCDRSHTRVMLTESLDRGRSWSPKRPLTEGTRGKPYYYNCARISALRDGRLVVAVDRCRTDKFDQGGDVLLYFSGDDGASWSEPMETPVSGIVPDKLLELASGRWLLAAHAKDEPLGVLAQRLWYSDDKGKSWNGPVIVGREPGLNLCEASILPLDGALVAFMRENSLRGLGCFKAISRDDGETWSKVVEFPLPGCHRPTVGRLSSGEVLITHRFLQGGKGGFGHLTQNLFAAITDIESCLAAKRQDAWARILPLDFDRSPHSDTGYSGWAQFDDGEIYVVNYIVDDAPKAQIRGYSLNLSDFVLPH